MKVKDFLNRRELFKLFGLTGLTSILLKSPSASSEENTELPDGELGFVFFNGEEAAFVKAYIDILIPRDDYSPSASECGVAHFIDRQLAGSFGAASRTYMQGPFASGSPSQGYQKPLSPSEIYRRAILELNEYCKKKYKLPFDMLKLRNQRKIVDQIYSKKLILKSDILHDFSTLIMNNTKEGFFADPVYLGNKRKASWKMIGYPGILALYARSIEKFKGKKYQAPVYSIEDID